MGVLRGCGRGLSVMLRVSHRVTGPLLRSEGLQRMPLGARFFTRVPNPTDQQVFEVTDEIGLREAVYKGDMEGTLILDCYADWCGPCKTLTPMLEAEVRKFPADKLRLAKLNVDEHERLPSSLKVTAIPAVCVSQGRYDCDFHRGAIGCPPGDVGGERYQSDGHSQGGKGAGRQAVKRVWFRS